MNASITYLNTAAVGILSEASVLAAQKFQESSMVNPSDTFFQWMNQDLPTIQNNLAQLAHAQANQLALTPNFSYSLLTIVHSIQPHIQKVLLFEDDYPSLNMPFELSGFEVHHISSSDGFSISLEELEIIIIREKIELLAISHVQFLTGYTIDYQALGEICKRHGVLYLLDTTQSLGALEIDFEQSDIDVMISSSYKWLNGGLGSAVMFLKDEFMQKYTPRLAGFGSMNHTETGWEYIASSKSYQPGHLNPLGIIQLGEAVADRLKQGVGQVQTKNESLVQHLISQLKENKWNVIGNNQVESLSTIVCVEAEQEVHQKFVAEKIVTTWRKGKIRISPHFHNTLEDIDKLVEVLASSIN